MALRDLSDKSSTSAHVSSSWLDVAPRRLVVPLATWSMPFVSLFAITAFVYLASFWLDVVATVSEQASDDVSIAALTQSIFDQDVDDARNSVAGLGEVMAAVLGLALTVSSIIVQLSATRFTPHITSLFFRARANLIVLGFFVVSSVYVLWVNFSIGDTYVPHWGVLLSMLLMTASLLMLFPYFAYVFDFLDPEKIVTRITADGIRAATPGRDPNASQLTNRQVRAIAAIDHLANIALNALQQKDKNIASSAIQALCRFGITYGVAKAGMPQAWCHTAEWIRQSPDFVSLSDDAIDDLTDRTTWLEWKLLRQYQMLFGEALDQIKDLCYLVAIETRRLGAAAAKRADIHTLDLAVKFFNTYLRAALNVSDIRTAYNVLHQYRQLAEYAVTLAQLDREGSTALDHRGVQVARFMRYYSSVAFQRGLSFVAEVIAHDLGGLCEHAFRVKSPNHEAILQIFLGVDEHAETKEQEKTLRGVRRAQVKLATTYLVEHATELAWEIADDMAAEPSERLRSIWNELLTLDSREFWEVNDRGTNFDYLTSEQKATLPRFFARFPALVVRPELGENERVQA